MKARREMVQEQSFKDKNRNCLVQKQTPSSDTRPHTRDTVLPDTTTICCQQYAQIGGVRVEARSEFRTRLAQRGGGGGGGGGGHVVPASTLSVLPALVSSLSLEVGGVPKTATQHTCQQPHLSLTHSQRGPAGHNAQC